MMKNKKLFTKKRIKRFIKNPRVAAPILAYLILLAPVLYLYSGSPPETEVQIYKGAWTPLVYPQSIPSMKDMGVNTVFLATNFVESEGRLLEPPFNKELLIANIQTAHKNGLEVALTVFIVPPYPKASDLDLEDLNAKIIESAKLAEKYDVEFFSPLNEPELIFGPSASATWGQEILPRIKEVYHGEVIWKGSLSQPHMIEQFLYENYSTNFSGYDYIGTSITPRAGMNLEDFSYHVDEALDLILAFAKRDNVKGVMITEFGVWEGDIKSEEDAARAHEIVLEKGENKVVGFFVLDSPYSPLGWTISGRIEEVIRRWYKEIL